MSPAHVRIAMTSLYTLSAVSIVFLRQSITPDPALPKHCLCSGPFPLEAWRLKASPADIRKVCVSACPQKNPNLRCGFRKRRLTNTSRHHRLADGQLSSLYAPPPSFSSFGAASVMMCCSARLASSSAPLRPSVHYPSISLVVNIYVDSNIL